MCELCRERRKRLMRELQAAAARIAALGEQPQPPGCQPEEVGPEEDAALQQLQEATRRLTELRQRRQAQAGFQGESAMSVKELLDRVDILLEQSRISLEQSQKTLRAMPELLPVKLDRTECRCDSCETD